MSDSKTAEIYKAKIYLETAALGFAAAVNLASDPPHAVDVEAHRGAREFLSTTALAYAATAGVPGAAERAELDALRRFRDGVVSLRGELVGTEPGSDPVANERDHVVETIDALLSTSYPAIGAPT